MFTEICDSYPDHLAAFSNRVQVLDSSSGDQHTEEIINLCKKVISGIDVQALLAFYGTKVDSRQDATKIKMQVKLKRIIFWLLMEIL